MNIFNWLIKTYYKIPTMHWRNPISFRKRDNRNLQWFKQRRKYGFDERELWNLGGTLQEAACIFLKIDKTVYSEFTYALSVEQFKKWFEKDNYGVKWISDRITIYIDWNCPTFYMDQYYITLPSKEQLEILRRMSNIINSRLSNKTIKEEDIKFLHEHIFHLGW